MHEPHSSAGSSTLWTPTAQLVTADGRSSRRGQAESKNLCLLTRWPSAEAIFLLPEQGVNMNLPQVGEDLPRHSF
jgi:hypothetical protein